MEQHFLQLNYLKSQISNVIYVLVSKSNNLTVLFIGTIMTKISSWKQLAIITSTDWSVFYKAF